MKKLLKFVKIPFVLCCAIGGVLLVYTYFIEPHRFVVNEQAISLPNWHRDLNGLRVVAASDIHGGSHTITEARIRSIVEEINKQNPDIVVLLGDFVSQIHDDGPMDKRPLKMPVETVAENLKGIKAKYGVFAVIGNHDWWYNEKSCRAALENVGFTVLENDSKSISINGQTVSIIGVEDFWRRRKVEIGSVLDRLEKETNILAIMHNPDSFDHLPASIALAFAGHTHGGQVNFPFVGSLIVPAKKLYTAGHVLKDGRNLFVTTGIGTSGLPFRFRVPPEIAVLTLNSQ